MIPAEAVEAAAREIKASDPAYQDDSWDELPHRTQDMFRASARAALEAAAPYMQADKRGDGDYLPGWDDRKELAHIWQEYAPLPDEGLSDGVYAALIAVATWGYEQRKDEAL